MIKNSRISLPNGIVSTFHKIYQSNIDVIKMFAYLGKTKESALKAMNRIIDKKNTVVPLFNTFDKNTIIRAKLITGINVT